MECVNIMQIWQYNVSVWKLPLAVWADQTRWGLFPESRSSLFLVLPLFDLGFAIDFPYFIKQIASGDHNLAPWGCFL